MCIRDRIGTGRREIGHGKLAWRAINSSLPTKEAFPYTFRVVSEITDKAKKLYEEDENYTDLDVNSQLKNLEKSIVRADILKNKNRIDGRGLSDVRPIECEVGVLPRAHGSALFTRGETQAIVVTTLGTSDDEQRIESLDGLQRERFMLHYNFPPFSVGETGRIGTGLSLIHISEPTRPY